MELVYNTDETGLSAVHSPPEIFSVKGNKQMKSE
jgi:hypothetical protein